MSEGKENIYICLTFSDLSQVEGLNWTAQTGTENYFCHDIRVKHSARARVKNLFEQVSCKGCIFWSVNL